MQNAIHHSQISSLPLLARGKVRDIYAVDDSKLLIVTSDRISAFDVILPNAIPAKGVVLTQLANFWFEKLGHILPNQLTGIDPESVVKENEKDQVRGRGLVVKRLQPLPIEAVVRGYIIGSGWKDYQKTGAICGIQLPKGLRLADQLPEAIFTPSSKAEQGLHDENISFIEAQNHASAVLSNALFGTGKNGASLVQEASNAALALYKEAANFARSRGIIIADTKFEFGIDGKGVLHLIDEALTPDSSRFWPLDAYEAGKNPPSFDKQYLRDYLETLDWNKTAPGPQLPHDVIAKTSAKYVEAYEKITGQKLVV